MFKKINKKGFTLAELLIVVAIIGVLVAISIPIFTAQLKKARLATNQANARAAYAAAVAAELDKNGSGTGGAIYNYTVSTAVAAKATSATGTAITGAIADWTTGQDSGILGNKVATAWSVTLPADNATTGATFNGTFPN